MALLDIAADWARMRGRRLTAITIDHGLNPASPDWSRLCQAAAHRAGVDWLERLWQDDKPKTGLTAAARTARHALIAEAARASGAKVVLFAHTADDIAESDWMRARPMAGGGSTLGRLREWSPSPAWPEGRGLMLFRPMLHERREVLRDWLRARGQDWIEDPGNADPRFGRSRARAALGDKAGGKGEDEAHRDPSLSLPRSSRSVRRASTPLALGEGFRLKPSVDATELAAVILCASGRTEPVRRDRLDRLMQRLGQGEAFVATLSGARIEAGVGGVIVGREPGEQHRRPIPALALTPGVPAVWDGRYEITVDQPGWTVTAAAGRLNRLSEADRAVLKTVRASQRATLPILTRAILIRLVLIRDEGDAPVLAWRKADVRALAPRRLSLFLDALAGETTQEADLERTIHGETPPPDLFSHD